MEIKKLKKGLGGGVSLLKKRKEKIDKNITVFVNMFDRNKVRPFQDFSGSSSFFTVEHFYEDGTLW